jgi:CheY-like chemotaxis protein
VASEGVEANLRRPEGLRASYLLVLAEDEYSAAPYPPRTNLTRSLGKRSGRSDAAAQKKRVAIVEDERDLLDLYSTYLRDLGYEGVFAVETGEELIKAVMDGRVTPEVIVMDYRLPGIDGIETAKRLLKIRPGTKVIVTTADDAVGRLADAEGYAFLRKPFFISTLVKTIAGL